MDRAPVPRVLPDPVIEDIPPAGPAAPEPAPAQAAAPRRRWWFEVLGVAGPWLLAAAVVCGVMRLCAGLVGLGGE